MNVDNMGMSQLATNSNNVKQRNAKELGLLQRRHDVRCELAHDDTKHTFFFGRKNFIQIKILQKSTVLEL